MSKTAAFCQKFLVNDANRRGERRKEETKKMEDWCVGANAYIGPPHRIPSQMPPALPFFLRRKKGRKERRQNQGFEILSAAEVLPVPVSFSHANQDKQISCLVFTWSLRLHLRCAPCLCWPILTGLFSASLVGRGAHTPPPKFA